MPNLAARLHVLRFAATVTYEFATTDGHQGRFTYDDTRVAVQQTSPSSPDSTLSFELDGRSFDAITQVLDNDNMRLSQTWSI